MVVVVAGRVVEGAAAVVDVVLLPAVRGALVGAAVLPHAAIARTAMAPTAAAERTARPYTSRTGRSLSPCPSLE